MVQLQNFIFIFIFTVVLCNRTTSILIQWLVSRDVPPGAPFSHGTIIPIFTFLLSFLVYVHSTGFIRSMDKTKRIVLIRTRPILLPNKSFPKIKLQMHFILFYFQIATLWYFQNQRILSSLS
jgi:hypothetical protein